MRVTPLFRRGVKARFSVMPLSCRSAGSLLKASSVRGSRDRRLRRRSRVVWSGELLVTVRGWLSFWIFPRLERSGRSDPR